MAFLPKMLTMLGAVGGFSVYLTMGGTLTQVGRFALLGFGLACLLLFVLLPGERRKRSQQRRQPAREVARRPADPPARVNSEEEESAEDLEARKLARLEGMEPEEEDEEHEEEEVHVAETFVITEDPEALEEAAIEEHMAHRREHHARVLQRIEDRRRSQLAEIRASQASMWEASEEREDLVGVLAKPGHGLEIFTEPAKVEPGHPYGATFIRIDDARVLRLRLPLDAGFQSFVDIVDGDESEAADTPDGLPPPPEGMDLPPPPEGLGLPPPPEGLPPPPPPEFFLTEGQARLAAFRDELDAD